MIVGAEEEGSSERLSRLILEFLKTEGD